MMLSFARVMIGESSSATSYINSFYNIVDYSRQDININARFVEMLVCFEKGEFRRLTSISASAYMYILKKRKFLNFEKELLKFYKNIDQYSSKADIPLEVFEKLLNFYELELKQPGSIQDFKYIDYRLWFNKILKEKIITQSSFP